MKRVTAGGGWPAIRYTLEKGREVGGLWKLYRALRSKNACKTCALGMGGQRGGMVNEQGHFPEICKKSIQAMAADMQGAIGSDFWSTYTVQQLQKFTPRQLEHCGRLVEPIIWRRGQQYYEPVSWELALDHIVRALQEIPADETFWYFSGRSSNEAGFLLQLFCRMFGTNNVNNCSYYCHQASGVGLNSSIGSGTASLVLEDLEHADLVFVIGGNPASNHPRLMTVLKDVRRRGGQVVVINPVRETGLVNFRVPSDPWSLFFGTRIATLYVQPEIGGDLALLTGIAKRLDELGARHDEFLQKYCEGTDAWLNGLRTTTWDEICEKSGVSLGEIDQIAQVYRRARNAVFAWTMGVTHHVHGVENVQAIANLALMRGMVGRPHAGLLPIRGHSNVQGIGSVGVTPQLKDAIFTALESEFGVKLPTTEGLDTLRCMEAAEQGRLKFGFCLGGNLYGSNPDSEFASRALSKLRHLVSLNTTLITGHAWGLADTTILLPVLARDEEPQVTTQESMFNLIRLSDGGPRRHAGPRSEIEVIATIAQRVLSKEGPFDWQAMHDSGAIRQVIAKTVPGFQRIAGIDRTKEEFQIGGRTFHQPKFGTASGKARLHRHALPALRGGGEQLRLMTVRSEGQFNTVVYEEYDLYRGQDRRDVILMHPADIQRLGLVPDQRVTVASEVGKLDDILVRSFPEIRAGNVLMYYPEANILVPRRADPQSQTPAFKGVVVTVSS
ncbi:MAG: FdhF/YdeP family oxidoreductase [Planctomycetales bacterium]|nr:FdhF/YdeP family oxidoreductase [Planctomycetales bacterium]